MYTLLVHKIRSLLDFRFVAPPLMFFGVSPSQKLRLKSELVFLVL